MKPRPIPFESGTFSVGANYWASHAGTRMWSDWKPDIVAADLRQLAHEGIQVLRVFPLWPDFQPLHQLYQYQGKPEDIRHGEDPLPDTEAGRAGINPVMMDRFRFLADEAKRNRMQLIVGLVTGWMSGRQFVPPAMQRLNVLTDPLAIQWQIRFVRYFVRTFRNHPAITAWDLGNECNCMGSVDQPEAAWLWTASISNAIRIEDPGRPVVSGMHGLSASPTAHWNCHQQGELTDILTTHPYPIFTPHCDQDPVNTIRNGLHATAESRLYADVGGKPCIAEEMGTLGPMVASESVAADYVRMALYSLWAHDCRAMLWWCAYDQHHLAHPPYDRHAWERELGLIRPDREPKPVIREISAFSRRLHRLPFRKLPPRTSEAVCILTEGQDHWAAAFATFILARQAGFDITFQYATQPLRPAKLYLLPSLYGNAHASRSCGNDLFDRVRKGATLYASLGNAALAPFNAPFGVEVQTREKLAAGDFIRFQVTPGTTEFEAQADYRLRIRPTTARVLAREPDGNPIFTVNRLNKGRVYYLSFPLEHYLSHAPGIFHRPDAPPYRQIYATLAGSLIAARTLQQNHPMVGITEHPFTSKTKVAVCINYSPEPVTTRLSLDAGWTIRQALIGKQPSNTMLTIPANNAVVLMLAKHKPRTTRSQS
ncbi:MAG: hypothetical protein A2498_04340 [Lentisphaerae bacterium RIFOXYC12_FULL_60_16]|nr:MAG: hypothetical protein A2498_04340 [Lentisphaerae bacterium RIFOXYC12_FULL_60_16]